MAGLRAKIYYTISPNRAEADKETIAIFNATIMQSVKDHWVDKKTGKPFRYWGISYLATAPRHQRKGYGSKVVRWGLAQADEDNTICGVNVSPFAIDFYKSLGFYQIGEVRLDGGVGLVCRRNKKHEGAPST